MIPKQELNVAKSERPAGHLLRRDGSKSPAFMKAASGTDLGARKSENWKSENSNPESRAAAQTWFQRIRFHSPVLTDFVLTDA